MAGFRPSVPTLALGAAGVLALAAVALAVLRPSEEAQGMPAAPATAEADDAAAPSLDEAAARIEARLRQDPDNAEGWFMLGLARREAGDHVRAEQAFRRAFELQPGNAEHAAHLGEALLLTGGDTPPPEAERLFRRALELAPGHPQARYYLATLKDLGGDHRGAVDDLIALLRDAPAGAPWETQVRAAATGIAGRNGIDVAGRLPPPPAAAAATAAIPGPTAAQMDAARAIPPGAQDEMVRGMVDRLAARLRAEPRDAEGWIRLMRSRMVLNEPDAARRALAEGQAAFEGDAAAQGRLRAAARTLGVPGA
jgi:cytochrome c-type biogenesis protein CcmH